MNAQQDGLAKTDITEFVTYKLEEYNIYNYKDVALWEAFTNDFQTFSVNSFKTCNQSILRNLREFLRQRRV